MRIFLLGFMGSGKSYWGKKLSVSLGLPCFDLDKEIEKKEGLSITAIFDAYGEDRFRQLEAHYLRILSRDEDLLLSCGGGTPCFAENMEFMNNNGTTLWLDVPVAVMVNRLKRNKHKRPLLKNLNDRELKSFVETKLEERKSYYAQSRLIVNPIKFDVHSLTQKIKSCTNRI